MSAPADLTSSTGASPPLSADNAQPKQPRDALAPEAMDEPASAAGDSRKRLAGDGPGAAVARAANDGSAAAGSAEADAQQGELGEASSASRTDTGKDNGASQPETAAANPPPLQERQDSVMAIGPAQDEIKAVAPGADDAGPTCIITLLLASGSRHPYRINARYLTRRNVPIPAETESGLPDPFSISIYTLKELILREWRADWEGKPSSPSSIRLIHFGKLLDDKEPLKKYQFNPDSPNVVHMSIRPPDLEEEEPKSGGKNTSQGRGDGQRERSGGCCVVL